MNDFLARNIGIFRRALDDHNLKCPIPASAFLLSRLDFELLCTTTLWGLEIVPDERVTAGRVRILCGGSAWGIEAELESYLRGSRSQESSGQTAASTA